MRSSSATNSHTQPPPAADAQGGRSSAALESMERRPHRPHVVAIAFPVQGHVGPLMKLSRQIARHGIRVTFVTTEWVHARMLQVSGDGDRRWGGIEMATVPEGMEEVKDMGDKEEVAETRAKVVSRHFEELLRKMNSSRDERVACVVADATVGWAFEVAESMGIKMAMFWPAAVPGLVLSLSIPRLVEAGVIDDCGTFFSTCFIFHEDIATNSFEHAIFRVFCFQPPVSSIYKHTFGTVIITTTLGKRKCNDWSLTKAKLKANFQEAYLKMKSPPDFSVGSASKDTAIQLSPELPAVRTTDLLWRCTGDRRRQAIMFRYCTTVNRTVKISNWLLCNSFHELDRATSGLIPELLPVGPLTSADGFGSFWAEDLTCLNWLDLQPPKSVIYVAFGSITAFSQHQFEELALGLELSGRPFLWVVRSGFTNEDEIRYPDGFSERVSDRGKIVSWAPQEKVLAHPSVSCFVTHCGWNSTMEGISRGVPFLCWPYFADQFYNRSYIYDTLKVGLDLMAEGTEIVSRHKIQAQLARLHSDAQIKENAEMLRGMAERSVAEGGSSSTNVRHFVEQLKRCSEAGP